MNGRIVSAKGVPEAVIVQVESFALSSSSC